ncbi:M20/M25/M40 family metallo-hydrolase, partial [Thalassotalea fusca]
MKKLSIGTLVIGLSVSVPLLALNADKPLESQKINQQKVNKKISSDSSKEEVWISIGNDAVSLVDKMTSVPFAFNNIQQIQHIKHTELDNNSAFSGQAVNVVSIDKSALAKLSEFMHDNFKRCGGFIFHNSLAEALKYTKKAASISATQSLINYTIDNPQGVNSLLNELSSANLATTVNTLSGYHNRYYTSTTGQQAAIWLKDHWTSIANSRNDISVELYNHSWQQSSVVATVTGTTNSEEIVIVGGHLDSINLSNPAGGQAPGADDNASGIAVLTETLRAIVASEFKPKRTVKFIGYAAEEVGLRGSGDIAQAYKSQGKQVIGVAQFDMSGYKGTSNKDIVFMTDYTNSAQNTFMTQLID